MNDSTHITIGLGTALLAVSVPEHLLSLAEKWAFAVFVALSTTFISWVVGKIRARLTERKEEK
jgi:hypothetical protein